MTDELKRRWSEVAYCLMPIFHPEPPHHLVGIGGKAVGQRTDGMKLTAVVILPTVWPEHFDWVQIARQRLDTLLDPECHCSQFGQCVTHQILAQQWATTDLATNVMVPETVPQVLHGIVIKKPDKLILPT